MSSTRANRFEPRNADPLIADTSLYDIKIPGNRKISVSGQVILLIDVGNVDRWTVFLILQKGGWLRGRGPGFLRDVIDCGAGWLQVVISESYQRFRDAEADLSGSVHC